MGIMAGKRGLIMGLANDKSLAWGIAKALAEQGAELAFSYQGPMMEKRVRPLAEALGVARLFECDVSSVESMDACFAALAVANTRAPQRRATCRAAWPTPPAAAWINTVSPGCRSARVCRPKIAVINAVLRLAPRAGSSAAGNGTHSSDRHTTWLAKLPTARAANWREPTKAGLIPFPTATTRPTHSPP